MIIATHMLLEFYRCHSPIDNAVFIEDALLKSVACAELTPLHQYFHNFDPPGVTGIIALAESHISIHTWPEPAYAVVDFMTCGDREKGLEACRYLEGLLKAEDTKLTETKCYNPPHPATLLKEVSSP